MFAEVVESAGYLDIRVDVEDAHFALGQRRDLRRFAVPIGPVLNFAAGNFPFAFSVAGGDSASALAAGCSVTIKGTQDTRSSVRELQNWYHKRCAGLERLTGYFSSFLATSWALRC